MLYWFFGTELGCSLRATGANPNMARAQGINTNVTKVLGLMISNGLVALAGGAAEPSIRASADVNMGRGAIVIGLAAVIIGEVIFGQIFHNFASEAAGRGLRRDHLLHRAFRWCSALGLYTDDLKLLHGAGRGACSWPFPYWKSKHFTKTRA